MFYSYSHFLWVFFFSIVGATVIAIGFYTVMWGKAKEEEMEENEEIVVDILESANPEKLPLLQKFRKGHSSNPCK